MFESRVEEMDKVEIASKGSEGDQGAAFVRVIDLVSREHGAVELLV